MLVNERRASWPVTTTRSSRPGRSAWSVTSAQEGTGTGAIARVGRQLGVNAETLRNWGRQAAVDAGEQPGVTSEEKTLVRELEKEVVELRRANEILIAAVKS